jgi:flagellar FliL protein
VPLARPLPVVRTGLAPADAAGVAAQEGTMAKDDSGELPVTRPAGSKLLPVMVATNTLLVVGLGALVLSGRVSTGPAAPPEEPGQEPSGDEPAAKPGQVGPLHTIAGLVVNLNDPSGDRYLRASIVLELSGEQMLQEVQGREGLIRDRIITFLSSLRFSQTQGARGKEEIRKGIANQVNTHLRTGKLRGVYFTEFVVQ